MTPTRILVGTDFSDLADLALERAVELALVHERSELHAACVLDAETAGGNGLRDGILSVDDAADKLRTAARLAITAARGRAERPGRAPRLFVHVRIGAPVEELVTLAAEIGADLLVVGTHGRRGLQRIWLGSVAEHAVRLASCPVLVVRPKREPVVSNSYRPEPPCRDCVVRRAASAGEAWWCERHEHPPEDAHHYSYSSTFDYTAEPYNKVW